MPTDRGLMDGPGTYSQPPQAGGSKDESGTAAKDTISIGSGDRVSGADRMGMEVHGEWMLPSIARNDPAYPDQDYWRGRVWAPMNFLTYLAFERQGLREACRDLAQKSVQIFEPEWKENRHVHENYNAITGEGCDVQSSDRFYHWGALLTVIALRDAGKQS